MEKIACFIYPEPEWTTREIYFSFYTNASGFGVFFLHIYQFVFYYYFVFIHN